jgi:pimeloyl-ACP methyl ester carboxylesterase
MPSVMVDGERIRYLEKGTGQIVLFLHGWGLDHRAYIAVVERIAANGFRVLAPALPGFGGTGELHGDDHSFAGYATWVDRFVAATTERGSKIAVVGHSFGGGVAVQFAHDFPERTASLLLVNSIGGSAWHDDGVIRAMAERPLWDWGLHFPSDVWPLRQATRVLPVILTDAVSNLIRNPVAYLKVAGLARRANLTTELETLRHRQLPVTVLWGNRDGIVPRESFEAMCVALGVEGTVVEGSHSWIIGDPDVFGELMTNDMRITSMIRGNDRKNEKRKNKGRRTATG